MATAPLAVSTRLLRDRPVADILGPLGLAGFDTLEVCALRGHFDPADGSDVTSLASACRRAGMRVLSLHAPYTAPVDITLVQRGERQQAVREVVTAAEALGKLGGRFLVIHAGSEVDPEPFIDARRLALRESLAAIHARCRTLGVELLVEEMEPHVFGGRDEDLRSLLALAPRPFDGFCLDVAHAFLAGSLLERVALLGPSMRLAHLADARGGSHEHLLPGDGGVPWARLLPELARAGVPCVLEVDLGPHPDAATLARARACLDRFR